MPVKQQFAALLITLESFTAANFIQLMEWVDDKRLMKERSGSLFSFPLSESGLTWYVEGANNTHAPDVFIYEGIDLKTGRTVGHISLGGINDRDWAGRITRVLVGNTTERRRSTCQGMVQALLRIGFEDLHRISLGVYVNPAAILLLEMRLPARGRAVRRGEARRWLPELGRDGHSGRGVAGPAPPKHRLS